VPLVLALLCLAAPGCANFWDEVTSRDFHFKDVFVHPDPMWVLDNSKDPDARARAMRSLKEPLQNGGTQQQQDKVVAILCQAVSQDSPVCRLAAIEVMRSFKDPRVVEPLINAYYQQGNYNPDTVTVIRHQALAALGEVKQPAAVEVLLRVAKEPPVEGQQEDRQTGASVRVVAIRGLGNYPEYRVAEALVDILRKEQNIVVRTYANESLKAITGKDFAPDARLWEEYLHKPGNPKDSLPSPGAFDKLLRLVSHSP
jgi:hypothetical protein